VKLENVCEDKATGADEIMPRFLSQISKEYSRPLWIIFRKSTDDGAPRTGKRPTSLCYSRMKDEANPRTSLSTRL